MQLSHNIPRQIILGAEIKYNAVHRLKSTCTGITRRALITYHSSYHLIRVLSSLSVEDMLLTSEFSLRMAVVVFCLPLMAPFLLDDDLFFFIQVLGMISPAHMQENSLRQAAMTDTVMSVQGTR